MSLILTNVKPVDPCFGEGFAFRLIQDKVLIKEYIYMVGDNSLLPLPKEGIARDVSPCASMEGAERSARQHVAFILANDVHIQPEPVAT